jgi:hypothetical protein
MLDPVRLPSSMMELKLREKCEYALPTPPLKVLHLAKEFEKLPPCRPFNQPFRLGSLGTLDALPPTLHTLTLGRQFNQPLLPNML